MEDIRVIPVAMGSDADVYELQKITPWIDDIVDTDKEDNPFKIAEKILMNGLKGELVRSFTRRLPVAERKGRKGQT